MELNELCKYLNITCKKNQKISKVVTSTKEIVTNCVLILITGRNFSSKKFKDEELINKCLLILSDEEDTNFYYIKDLKKKVFDILYFFYFPYKHKFKLIGITGTEGKSSLSDIIYQGLSLDNKKCLLISTENKYKDVFFSELTTPSSSNIIKAMLYAEENKYEYLIMEVSSIAISEYRINGNIFDYLFLTNLEEDHLDYHLTLKRYHEEKINLFLSNLKAKKYIFDFTYNKYKELFLKVTNLKIIKINEIISLENRLDYQVFKYENNIYSTKLIFLQNRINLVFLIELLKEMNINNLQFLIQKINRVKGRLDLIHQDKDVFIDYAHSPKSMENVLSNIKECSNKKIVLVFGAGGSREKEKRKKYGKISLKYADRIILTNDNPRQEDPINIIKDIISLKEGFEVILSRKEAIKTAIENATNDEIVVILGRGNEKYQLVNNLKIELNDYDICHEVLYMMNS